MQTPYPAFDGVFIVVSGLPASGKTTLARRLAGHLDLPLIDKDDILERMFEEQGSVSPAVRSLLSRRSDGLLQASAMGKRAAVVVSYWQNPDRSDSTGTPSGWLRSLPGHVIEVHCKCSPELARQRFANRSRHTGHNDAERMPAFLTMFDEIARRYPLKVGPYIEVDVSPDLDIAWLARRIASKRPDR